ncbi:MAG: hypothetical protein ACK4GQ_00535 [Candidatus Hadarchaeales archaeon]
MKKEERVIRQILYQYYELDKRFTSQKELSTACRVSLGSVHRVVDRLARLGAIEKKPLGFRIIDPTRILLYWANTRNLHDDILGRIETSQNVANVEMGLPPTSVMTAYSAVKKKIGSVPREYREVHAYGSFLKIKQRFKESPGNVTTIIVLKPDDHLLEMSQEMVAPLGQIYVDLWQLGAPAKQYVEFLDKKMKSQEMTTLRGIISRTKGMT